MALIVGDHAINQPLAQAAQEKEYTKVDGVIQPDKDVLECVKTWSAEAYAREKYSSYMAEREPVSIPTSL